MSQSISSAVEWSYSIGRPAAQALSEKMRLLIIGGQSKAAKAFRRMLSGLAGFEFKTLVRRPETTLPHETIYTVSDYFQPPPAVLEGVKVIVNFTGIANPKDPNLVAVNVEGPKRLATFAAANGIARLVHISSLSVYGAATDIAAKTPELPISLYGRSKRDGDDALMRHCGESVSVSILRVPILYGRDTGEKLHGVARAITRLRWWPLAQADQLRSILHVENLAASLLDVLATGKNGILFAADPEPFTFSLLREVAESCTGRSIRLIRFPKVVFAPLQVAAPAIYRSLYTRSYIEPTLCIAGSILSLKSTSEGLKDLFREGAQT